MGTIIFIGILLVILLVCVTVHEWGHFFAARKSGMLVEEFGFGIPPRLFSWKKGETTYSINALPIGGFVKIAGENGIDASIPAYRQFESKPWYLKAFVLVAGVVCNVILAILLLVISYSAGLPHAVEEGGTPTVISVSKDSAAEKAGITPGDELVSVTIGTTEVVPISVETLRTALSSSQGSVSIEFVQDGETKNVSMTLPEELETRKIGIGVVSVDAKPAPLGKAIVLAWNHSMSVLSQIFSTIGSLVAGPFMDSAQEIGMDDLSGPVGLYSQVKSAATIGTAYLLAFTGIISLNLAVLNILPFPALDGGRLLIVLLEAVTRKTFSKSVVNTIHALGFLALLALMAYLTIGDIGKL